MEYSGSPSLRTARSLRLHGRAFKPTMAGEKAKRVIARLKREYPDMYFQVYPRPKASVIQIKPKDRVRGD